MFLEPCICSLGKSINQHVIPVHTQRPRVPALLHQLKLELSSAARKTSHLLCACEKTEQKCFEAHLVWRVWSQPTKVGNSVCLSIYMSIYGLRVLKTALKMSPLCKYVELGCMRYGVYIYG